MAEIITKLETVLLHIKGSEPVAVTVFNGKTTIYILQEANRKAIEEFYETHKM